MTAGDLFPGHVFRGQPYLHFPDRLPIHTQSPCHVMPILDGAPTSPQPNRPEHVPEPQRPDETPAPNRPDQTPRPNRPDRTLRMTDTTTATPTATAIASRLDDMSETLVGPTARYLSLVDAGVQLGVEQTPAIADAMLAACRYDVLAQALARVVVQLEHRGPLPADLVDQIVVQRAERFELAALDAAIEDLDALIVELGSAGEPS